MSEPTELARTLAMIDGAIAAARAEGWQAANHAWQDWLEANIPDWDAMAGIDLTTLPREPK
jgi:hypothetical protein